MKRIIFLVCLYLCSLTVFAISDDCNEDFEYAKKLYYEENYEDAKIQFNYVKKYCNIDVDAWIKKCDEALNPRLVGPTKPTQPNTTLKVDKNKIETLASGGVYYINVISSSWNYDWPYYAEWCKITKESNALRINISENNSPSPRYCSFKIWTSDNTKQEIIAISQSGKATQPNSIGNSKSIDEIIGGGITQPKSYIDVTPTNIAVDANSGKKYIKVTSNVKWVLTDTVCYWYDLKVLNGSIELSYKENKTEYDRTDYFHIQEKNNPNNKVKVNIKQLRKPQATISVSRNSVSVSDKGATEKVKVTSSNPNWTIGTLVADWLSIWKENDEVIIVCKENNSYDERKYVIPLYSSGKLATITITQKGKPFVASLQIDRETIFCESKKSKEIIKINSNTEWSYQVSDNNMISIVDSDKKELTIQINKNKSTSKRECTITIKTKKGSLSKEIKVVQDGKFPVKPSNFIMLNGGFTTLPDYSFGLTYSWVKTSGFYVSALSNFNFKFNADYIADSKTSINGTYPLYSGEKEYTKLTATVGYVGRLGAPVYLYFGAGYGYRGLFYETVNKDWVAIQGNHCVYHGGVAEFGLMGNIYGFALSLGFSVICDLNNLGNYYPEAKVGIGYCF